ncbi:MAG: class I SAM-dependent methyltransferase [Candidatus Hodarchaeales archaeon]|jgi:ubiquinone/menaquinone biosynthesis C-methylase UbiE
MKLVPSEINGYYCPDDPGEPSTGEKRLSVNDFEAKLIGEFTHGLDVLEIGTGLGVATRALAKNAHMVYTVDIDPWVAENVDLPDNAELFTNTDGFGNNSMHMAFIDGWHSLEAVQRDIIECQRIVKPGGLIALHDMKIGAVVAGIMRTDLEVFTIDIGLGIGLGWNEQKT